MNITRIIGEKLLTNETDNNFHEHAEDGLFVAFFSKLHCNIGDLWGHMSVLGSEV